MGDLTKLVPKPMLPIEGKPVLQYHVELLKRYGIKDILLTVGHLSDSIEEYFGDGSRFGVKISYLAEKEPMGTAGVLSQMEIDDDAFLVLYGDVLVNVDLDRLFKFHKQKGSQVTLAVHPSDHPQDSDVISLDVDSRVKAVVHRPQTPEFGNLTNACLYVMDKESIKVIPNKKVDFAKDLFPAFINQFRVFGYNTPEYLRDMGTPQRYQQVCQHVRDGTFASGRLH